MFRNNYDSFCIFTQVFLVKYGAVLPSIDLPEEIETAVVDGTNGLVLFFVEWSFQPNLSGI